MQLCPTCHSPLSLPTNRCGRCAPASKPLAHLFEDDTTSKLAGVPVVQAMKLEVEAIDIESRAKSPRTVIDDGLNITQTPRTPISSVSALAAPVAAPVAVDLKPKLQVLRGERIDKIYSVYPGKNFVGRMDEKPVDIDLEEQEPPDRIWVSRQHAVIAFENGQLLVEDLNSLNGTFVNRARVHPGQPRTLQANDVIQIGTVQLKLIFG